MTTYVAEAYLARSRADDLTAVADRARAAARQLTEEGTAIRYVRSTFVPEDEMCFHLFEAGSADAVSEASARAGLGEVRVVAAIGEGEGRT